jgi:hypothetical protein
MDRPRGARHSRTADETYYLLKVIVRLATTPYRLARFFYEMSQDAARKEVAFNGNEWGQGFQ